MHSYFTSFEEIYGNEEIKKQLLSMLSKQSIGHSLLFVGPEGVGKGLFAWALASQLLSIGSSSEEHLRKMRAGHHPDVHVFRPEGKIGLHSIQSMRRLKEEASMPPYEAQWKVFIVHDADRMMSYSAHALLKTFEEPTPRTLIILLSRSRSSLLPTLLSRCRTLYFHSISIEEIAKFLRHRGISNEEVCLKIARASKGSIQSAIHLVEKPRDAEQFDIMSLLIRSPFRNYRCLQDSVKVLNDKIEELKLQTEKNLKEERSRFFSDQLSLQQREFIEKEIEGSLSISFNQEARLIFDSILSWYRDLFLLSMGADSSLLINSNFYQELVLALKRTKIQIPFEEVLAAVEKAYSDFQRSTPFSICLENLFLKLQMIA